MPSATKPTVPSKNFFISRSPVLVRFLWSRSGLNSRCERPTIQFVVRQYPIHCEIPSPKCNTRPRSERREVNDLFTELREPGGILTGLVMPGLLRSPSSTLPRAVGDRQVCSGTKLEHCRRRCYMWITVGSPRDRRAQRLRRAYRVGFTGGPKRGPEGDPENSSRRLSGSGRVCQYISGVESGDGGKREQGDSGRQSRQGSGNPADPGRAADRQSEHRDLGNLARQGHRRAQGKDRVASRGDLHRSRSARSSSSI